MKTIPVQLATRALSKLIEMACRGEEVTIDAGSDQIVRLVPVRKHKGSRKVGILRGKLLVGPEFFEPLPPEELTDRQ